MLHYYFNLNNLYFNVNTFFFFFFSLDMASQVVLVAEKLPANEGDLRDMGLIPGSGRSLEEGLATYSSILAWRIP